MNVNASDKGIASQIPEMPISSGNNIKAGTSNRNPRRNIKVRAAFINSRL